MISAILPTPFIHFVQGRLGELRSGYLELKVLSRPLTISGHLHLLRADCLTPWFGLRASAYMRCPCNGVM